MWFLVGSGIFYVWELCGSWSDFESDVRVEDEIIGFVYYVVKVNDFEECLEGMDMVDLGEIERMR